MYIGLTCNSSKSFNPVTAHHAIGTVLVNEQKYDKTAFGDIKSKSIHLMRQLKQIHLR